MRLSEEEFKAVKFLRECVIEIPSLQTNVVNIGGVDIEIVTDFELSEENRFELKKKWLELGRRLAAMPRETEDKKALRREYIEIKTKLREAAPQDRETEQVSQNKNATRRGKLIKLPLSTNIVHGNIFGCELDCKEGDDVYFDAFWTQQQIARKWDDKGEEYVIHVGDKIYLKVPAVSLFCSVNSNGEYKGLNGYVIAEPIDQSEIVLEGSGLIVPQEPKKLPMAKVIAVSKHLPKFRDQNTFMNTKVKVGDLVYTEPRYQTRLDKTGKGENKLVRIPNFKILKIEN
jgi:co-chaperonin GroES (HSP10)